MLTIFLVAFVPLPLVVGSLQAFFMVARAIGCHIEAVHFFHKIGWDPEQQFVVASFQNGRHSFSVNAPASLHHCIS